MNMLAKVFLIVLKMTFLFFADDENSHVHAVLTTDNLLDGTIETPSENFYIEPSHRYSEKLNETGVHSIIYKLSDVDMRKPAVEEPSQSSSAQHCASERLRRSMLLHELKRRKSTSNEFRRHKDDLFSDEDIKMYKRRSKRWLPEEVSNSFAIMY